MTAPHASTSAFVQTMTLSGSASGQAWTWTGPLAFATDGTVNGTGSLVFQQPPLTVAALTVNPPSVSGGQGATGTVTLNRAPGTAVQIALRSDGLTIPATVTVNVNQTSGTFAIGTPVPTGDHWYSIAASYNGQSRGVSLFVKAGAAPPPVVTERLVGPGQPYATPAAALAVAVAGDTITLKAGTYPGNLVITKANLTLRAAPGETAVIACPTTDAAQVNTVWFQAPGGALRGLEITGGNYFGVKFEQGSGTVTGCKVHDAGVGGIKIVPGANDITITGTEVYRTGIRTAANAQGIDAVRSDRLHVADCVLHDIPDMAICAKGGSRNAVIERCRISDCWIGAQLGQVTDRTYLDSATNPGLYENQDGIIRNCLIQRCRYAGIGLWAALRPQVLNNTVLLAGNEGQAALLMNTADRYDSAGNLTLVPVTDATMANNVFTVPAAPAQAGAPVFQIRPGAFAGTLSLSHNRYWAGGKPTRFLDNRSYYAGKTLDFDGPFGAWAPYAKEVTSSEGDPQLGPDSRPLPTSPLKGAGLSLLSLTDDLAGVRRPAAPSIGALEPLAPAGPPNIRKISLGEILGEGFGDTRGELWVNGYPTPAVLWTDERVTWAPLSLRLDDAGLRRPDGAYMGLAP